MTDTCISKMPVSCRLHLVSLAPEHFLNLWHVFEGEVSMRVVRLNFHSRHRMSFGRCSLLREGVSFSNDFLLVRFLLALSARTNRTRPRFVEFVLFRVQTLRRVDGLLHCFGLSARPESRSFIHSHTLERCIALQPHLEGLCVLCIRLAPSLCHVAVVIVGL